ncbi:MAG: beta-lactamase family protein [Proteobacteria bacterium]|nr:beta-lactamase family protein [Pseudomonadota bacterium]
MRSQDSPTVGVFPQEEPVDAAFVGMSADRLRKVVRAFKRQQRRGLFPGGQIAIRRHGSLVVNEPVGIARGFLPEHNEAAIVTTPQTLFPCFSAGKAVIAIIVAMLEERGQLAVEEPVAKYFPEFGAGGKGDITVLDVLTHRGGVLMPEFCKQVEAWADWDRVVEAMIAAEPSHRRGTLAYHPLEYGWVLSEVIQRVDGRTVQEFVRDELAEPMGLPELKFGARPSELARVGRSYWVGSGPFKIAGLDISGVFETFHHRPELMTIFLPGAGLMTNAATLAAFYEMLVSGGVARDGTRLLSRDTIRKYTTRHVMGWDRSNKAPIVLGRGFFLGTKTTNIYGWWDTGDCFGHAGAFCTLGWGDHRLGLAVGIVSNGNSSPMDLVTRMIPICDGIRKACL